MIEPSEHQSILNKNIKNSDKFLIYIHDFRGFAILLIVANHVIGLLQWEDNLIERKTHILIGNGTTCFVFVAGFLFQFLSANYKYQNYLIKKLQYVLLPYLFMSIPAITFCIVGEIYTPDWFNNCFSNWSIPAQILMYLLTGAHLTPFWFIPMITIFYIVSPILLWSDRHPKIYWILPMLLTITLVVPRPEHNDNSIQSFVHFLSIYMVGMFCSHFRKKLFSIMQKYFFWSLIVFLILTVLEIVVTPRPVLQSTTINSLSKLILCLLIIYLLYLTELRLPKLFHDSLGLLAELSFGIYFFHEYFLVAYTRVAYKFGFNLFLIQANLLNFSLILLFGVGASVVSLLLIKRTLGKKSRFIIGC